MEGVREEKPLGNVRFTLEKSDCYKYKYNNDSDMCITISQTEMSNALSSVRKKDTISLEVNSENLIITVLADKTVMKSHKIPYRTQNFEKEQFPPSSMYCDEPIVIQASRFSDIAKMKTDSITLSRLENCFLFESDDTSTKVPIELDIIKSKKQTFIIGSDNSIIRTDGTDYKESFTIQQLRGIATLQACCTHYLLYLPIVKDACTRFDATLVANNHMCGKISIILYN